MCKGTRIHVYYMMNHLLVGKQVFVKDTPLFEAIVDIYHSNTVGSPF